MRRLPDRLPHRNKLAANERVSIELQRLKTLLNEDSVAGKEHAKLGAQIRKEEHRRKLIDAQVAGIAKDTSEYAEALAALVLSADGRLRGSASHRASH